MIFETTSTPHSKPVLLMGSGSPLLDKENFNNIQSALPDAGLTHTIHCNRQLAPCLCLRGPSIRMHWMGSLQRGWLPGAQVLPPHRGEGSTHSPGPVLNWKPQGPGQCCCPGSEPAAAPRGLAGALPQLSCNSSSPQTLCLSHQPNTAALPGSEEGRWIASMPTCDFSRISEC